MFGLDRSSEAYTIGFILVKDFSMISFASAIEPLRLANQLSNKILYSGICFSIDGNPIHASNGLKIIVDGAISEIKKLDILFVCSGNNISGSIDKKLLSILRHSSSHGTYIGGICTGSYILAKAGLLNNYRCTIHWQNLASFAEEFPKLNVTSSLFEIDNNRYTCAGGTASIDMMLNIICGREGVNLSTEVANQMLHHRVRDGSEAQRMELRSRLGITHPKLIAVVEAMAENIEAPLSCVELSEQVKISSRQLERLFQKYLNSTPTRYYLELRLIHTRLLLQQTSLSILSVALSGGFVSASHFSKSYREYFMTTPSSERNYRNYS